LPLCARPIQETSRMAGCHDRGVCDFL